MPFTEQLSTCTCMHLIRCTEAEGDDSQLRMRLMFVWKLRVIVREKQCQ